MEYTMEEKLLQMRHPELVNLTLNFYEACKETLEHIKRVGESPKNLAVAIDTLKEAIAKAGGRDDT